MCRVKDVFSDKLIDDPTQLIDALQRTELVGKHISDENQLHRVFMSLL